VRDIAADYTLCQENSPHFPGKGKEGGPSQREEVPPNYARTSHANTFERLDRSHQHRPDYLNGYRHGESTNSSGPKINGRCY